MDRAERSGPVGGGRSRRPRGRRWIAAGLATALVVLVVFVLAQTGGGGSGPLDAIARAASVTQQEPGGHALLHSVVTASNSPEGITETGSMVFENGGRARGALVVSGHTTGQRVAVQVIADGTTAYTSSDQLDSLSEGHKWVEIDLSQASSSSSLPADGGPTEGLKLLEKMDGGEELGKEGIRGVATTHYSGTLPISEKEAFGVAVEVSPPQVEVWIDAQHRVRRMTIVISGSVGAEEGTTTTEMTVDFLDFHPVSKIELPQQDEIYDATNRFESEFRSSAESR